MGRVISEHARGTEMYFSLGVGRGESRTTVGTLDTARATSSDVMDYWNLPFLVAALQEMA